MSIQVQIGIAAVVLIALTAGMIVEHVCAVRRYERGGR